MSTITQMLNRSLKAKSSLNSDLETIVNIVSDDMMDLIRNGQLGKGLNSQGQIIGRYSPLTEILSGGEKKAGDPYNFYDTGDLFRKFSYKFSNGKLDIFSTDSKVPILKDKYEKGNSKLFLLSIDHQHEINYEMIKPILTSFIRKHLQL